MAFNIGKGLLSGIAGTANAYGDALKEQSDRKYEDLKAKALYDQKVSLEGLRAKSMQGLAQEKRGWQLEDRAAAEKLTGQERERTDFKALEPYLALAKQNNPDVTSPEELMLEAEKLRGQHQVSKITAGKAPTGEEKTAALKEASKIYEGLDSKQQGKLLKEYDGNIPAVIRSIAGTLAPSTAGFEGSISGTQLGISEQRRAERLDEAVIETAKEIEGLGRQELLKYKANLPAGVPQDITQLINDKLESLKTTKAEATSTERQRGVLGGGYGGYTTKKGKFRVLEGD